MDKDYPSKTPMVIRALEKDSDPFQPCQEGEEVLGSEYPYLNAIGALMYLANNMSIGSPTIIYEDNAACIAQIQSGYVKSNVTKHIISKLFYPYEL
jgi:hypothetical protein